MKYIYILVFILFNNINLFAVTCGEGVVYNYYGYTTDSSIKYATADTSLLPDDYCLFEGTPFNSINSDGDIVYVGINGVRKRYSFIAVSGGYYKITLTDNVSNNCYVPDELILNGPEGAWTEASCITPCEPLNVTTVPYYDDPSFDGSSYTPNYALLPTSSSGCSTDVIVDWDTKWSTLINPDTLTQHCDDNCYGKYYDNYDCLPPDVLIDLTPDDAVYFDSCVPQEEAVNTCSDGQYLALSSNYISYECSDIPECAVNMIFNTSYGSCECSAGFALDSNGTCSTDTDGDGIPNTEDGDVDGDGISNELDNDIDGDGINNDIDEDDYNPDGNLDNDRNCQGSDTNTIAFYGIEYPISTYNYYGITIEDDCKNIFNVEKDMNFELKFDGSYTAYDINQLCESVYCFTHSISNDCNFDALEYKPSPDYVYYSYIADSLECDNKVDFTNFTSSSFIVPDINNCPNTGFCYLLPNNSSDYNDTNTSTVDNPDLNTTTTDLAPLLEAQNNTNDLLTDIKKDIGKSLTDIDTKFDKLNNTQNDLLAVNQQIKTTLDKMSMDTINESILSELKYNSDLEQNSIGQLSDINNKLSSINAYNSAISGKLDIVNTSITDGLMGDIDPFADINLSDGSEKFDSYAQTFEDSIGFSYYDDILGLSTVVASSNLETISFVFYGTTMILFEPSMLDSIPIADIRNLFLFFFALAGFITVFRSV